MDFIYIFLGILILIPLASWLMLVIKLHGTRLTRVGFKPLKSIKLPAANKQQFKQAQADLAPLGFEFFHFHAYRDLIVSDNKPTVGMVLKNDQHQCYALITNPHNPDLNRPYGIRFQSFTEQITLEAMDADAEGIIKSFEQLHTYNFQTTSAQEAFDEFLTKRTELFDNQKTGISYFKEAQAYCQHMQSCYDQYLKHLFQTGLVHKKDSALQLRFSQATKLAWQMMSQNKKVTPVKALDAPALVEKYSFLPKVQAQAHSKVQTNQQASQLGHWGKTLLFIASALMFALLFGIAWSPFLVIILIPVLLFHELGHYLAMKAFGYRDLQILFLPIGAMAAGQKSNPSPLQKTIVSLAGPVPGLLLAFAMAVWAPDFIYTEYGLSMIFMLIIINYLNLLPFMPLDGGHVVNLLVFDRWPMLQFVLMLTSVCIFALGAWAWSDPILTVLAVVFGLGLKNNYQQAKYVIEARKRWGEKLKNRDNLAVAYHLMKEDPSPFTDKYQTAMPINDRLRHQSPTWRDSLLGMTLYLTAIVGPLVAVDKIIGLEVLALLGGAFSQSESYEEYDANEADKWREDYWLEQFQNAKTAETKQATLKNAIAFATENEDSYMIAGMAPQAIEFLESNQLQSDPDYPLWIKHNIMNQIYEDPEASISEDLNKLADLFGNDSMAYAEVLVEVLAWQTSDELKGQLISRLPLFVEQQKFETLYEALMALQPYEEQQDYAQYEQILTMYLPLFKANAPDYYADLQHSYWQILFAQQRYFEILELAKNETWDYQEEDVYIDSFKLELLAWTALLDHQYQRAKDYQQKRKAIEQQQQAAMKKELGFLAGMVMKDQDIYGSVLSDPLFNLALAVQKNDPSLIKKELTSYEAVIQTWQKTSLKDFLQKLEHFETSDSQQLQYV